MTDRGHPDLRPAAPAPGVQVLRFTTILMAGLLFGAAIALLVIIVRNASQASASLQPPVERAAQRRLPHSTDPLWATLGATMVREDQVNGILSATFPAPVKALAGRTVTVSGFMLPLDTGMTTQHFLLSKFTPVCPFCPPGAPNEVIEVRSASPIYLDNEQIELTGRFSLQNDGNAGLFFRLDQAQVDD